MTTYRMPEEGSWQTLGWVEREVTPELAELGDYRLFQRQVEDGHLSVITGAEPAGWHLSISHRLLEKPFPPGRYLTWDELKDARYLFCPLNVYMAQILPPPEEYVNDHETTFHLWEVK